MKAVSSFTVVAQSTTTTETVDTIPGRDNRARVAFESWSTSRHPDDNATSSIVQLIARNGVHDRHRSIDFKQAATQMRFSPPKGRTAKTAQELLRHANGRITLRVYTQIMNSQNRVHRARLFRGRIVPNPGKNGFENVLKTLRKKPIAPILCWNLIVAWEP